MSNVILKDHFVLPGSTIKLCLMYSNMAKSRIIFNSIFVSILVLNSMHASGALEQIKVNEEFVMEWKTQASKLPCRTLTLLIMCETFWCFNLRRKRRNQRSFQSLKLHA